MDDDVTLLLFDVKFPSPIPLLERRFSNRFVTRLLCTFSPLKPLVNNSFSYLDGAYGRRWTRIVIIVFVVIISMRIRSVGLSFCGYRDEQLSKSSSEDKNLSRFGFQEFGDFFTVLTSS